MIWFHIFGYIPEDFFVSNDSFILFYRTPILLQEIIKMASLEGEAPIKQCVIILEKKVRNLEKRKVSNFEVILLLIIFMF